MAMTGGRTFVANVTITSWPQSGAGFGFAEIVDGGQLGEQVSIKAPVIERLTSERGWTATSLGRTFRARLGPNPGRRPDAPPWQLLDVANPTFEDHTHGTLLFGLAEDQAPFEATSTDPVGLAERVKRLEEQIHELRLAVFGDHEDRTS
ncbi:MAG: hypothetical protein ACOC3D_11085 [Pseudomonadota bacterium]